MRPENLSLLYSSEQIGERVKELAETISRDYESKSPLLLCVLKGAVVFLADLLRHVTTPVEIDFVAASSYHRSTSMGTVDISPLFSTTVYGKDILIVEDIIDTGLTYQALIDYFSAYELASLKLCALLDKPSERRTDLMRPDYIGFSIPDQFVVGYGLDYNERYRGLRDIYIFKPDEPSYE